MRFRLPKSGDGIDAVCIEFDGEEEWIPHLPGALFDRCLTNLSNSKDERAALFSRFRGAMDEALETLYGERVTMTAGMPLVDQLEGKPDASVTIA